MKERIVKVAISQINSCVGALEGNAEKVVNFIKRAEKHKADFVV